MVHACGGGGGGVEEDTDYVNLPGCLNKTASCEDNVRRETRRELLIF